MYNDGQIARGSLNVCGISGLISKKQLHEFIPDFILKMNQAIAHRGPNGEGAYYYENIGFGHRRLSILDLSEGGHQPMTYNDKQYVITYNGEIYNYIELKKELEQLGYGFKSLTDTEVILAAYAEWGQDCVSRFNGMWAFAILDKQQSIIFCSRDRFGVKPFYYLDTPEVFVFGSEIKQLLPFQKQVDPNMNLVLDFILTSISDHTNETFFNNILKLPAGHNLIYKFKEHLYEIKKYYDINYHQEYQHQSAEEVIERYFSLLEDAIRIRLRSDVRVGTCLSGGLDSSTVASIAATMYPKNQSYRFSGITAVSEQESNNEAGYAKQVVDFSDLDWIQVKPTYDDFVASLDDLVRTQEEPFGSTSLTMQYFVMKSAREHGIPVLLDGQGGDETLLGYEKYYGSYLITTLKQQGPKVFLQALRSSGANNSKMGLINAGKYLLGTSMPKLRYHYYCRRHTYLKQKPAMPIHLMNFSNSIWDSFLLQKLEMTSTNLPVLLRYEDKNSMAHSIETRLPFLDYRVVEAALSIPGHYKIKDGWSKWLLRKGMEQRMPASIAWRKNKFGFEAPEAIWMKRHSGVMYEAVSSSELFGEITKLDQLNSSFKGLDIRSQWRLYSAVKWLKIFGIES